MPTESLASLRMGEGSQRGWANIGLKEMVRAKSFSEWSHDAGKSIGIEKRGSVIFGSGDRLPPHLERGLIESTIVRFAHLPILS
jgi:hypothetical protein